MKTVQCYANEPDEIEVEVGPSSVVYIDKIIGPTAAEKVRIRFEIDSVEWVVERQRTGDCEGHDLYSPNNEHEIKCPKDVWEEKARWYAQESF